MKEDDIKKISTLNYIYSWAKLVRIQALEMDKLFKSNIGKRWSEYSNKEGDIRFFLDEIINHSPDSVDDMES